MNIARADACDSEQRRQHEQGGREQDIVVRQVIPEQTKKSRCDQAAGRTEPLISPQSFRQQVVADQT